jgi:protein involved in polysaccharide export with SLBB domain
LPLPLIDPLPVAGLTVNEVRKAIAAKYLEEEIILPEEQIVLATLIRPRQVRVLVIREDSPQTGANARATPPRGFVGNIVSTGSRRGTGDVVELPAYQNDLLTALARTGGLPGTDAQNEVIIQRAGVAADDSVKLLGDELKVENEDAPKPLPIDSGNEVHIPLRLLPGQEIPFREEDVLLNDGDVVFVKARPPEFYFTGGVMPAIQVPLPRDEDVDVLEAIATIGGPLLNGGLNANNLAGGTIADGVGGPSPKLLTIIRRTPTGQQFAIRVDLDRALVDSRERILIRADDFLLLQETPSQAVARYLSRAFQFNLFGNIYETGDSFGTGAFSGP